MRPALPQRSGVAAEALRDVGLLVVHAPLQLRLLGRQRAPQLRELRRDAAPQRARRTLQLGGFPVLLLLAVPQCEQTLLQRLHAALQPLLGGARGG